MLYLDTQTRTPIIWSETFLFVSYVNFSWQVQQIRYSSNKFSGKNKRKTLRNIPYHMYGWLQPGTTPRSWARSRELQALGVKTCPEKHRLFVLLSPLTGHSLVGSAQRPWLVCRLCSSICWSNFSPKMTNSVHQLTLHALLVCTQNSAMFHPFWQPLIRPNSHAKIWLESLPELQLQEPLNWS